VRGDGDLGGDFADAGDFGDFDSFGDAMASDKSQDDAKYVGWRI